MDLSDGLWFLFGLNIGKVFVCSPCWPGTHCVDQGGFKLTKDLPAPGSWVLGLKPRASPQVLLMNVSLSRCGADLSQNSSQVLASGCTVRTFMLQTFGEPETGHTTLSGTCISRCHRPARGNKHWPEGKSNSGPPPGPSHREGEGRERHGPGNVGSWTAGLLISHSSFFLRGWNNHCGCGQF